MRRHSRRVPAVVAAVVVGIVGGVGGGIQRRRFLVLRLVFFLAARRGFSVGER